MCFSLRYNGFPEGQELPKASLADWIEMMGGGEEPLREGDVCWRLDSGVLEGRTGDRAA